MIHLDNPPKFSFKARLRNWFLERLMVIRHRLVNWDECPICGGSGLETMDIVDGCDIKATCCLCKGRGKISLRQLIDYRIHINEPWKPEVQE